MKRIFLVVLIYGLAVFTVVGQEAETQPYITINVGVEMDGIEAAAGDVANASKQLAESLSQLSAHPDLTQEQREHIVSVLGKVDVIANEMNQSVMQLPAAVESSGKPVLEVAEQLGSEAKWILIVAALVLVFILLAALAAVYFLIIAPSGRLLVTTTGQLNSMATALKTAATLVESTSVQNERILLQLEAQQAKRNGTPD